MRTPRQGQALQDAVAAVATLVAPHLQGSAVLRSTLEAALGQVEGGAELRVATIAALESARITVVEDVPHVDPLSGLVPAHVADEAQPVEAGTGAGINSVDADVAVAAARRRIQLDHQLSQQRRGNVLLTAIEEVGLALIYRRGQEALAAGQLSDLQGEARDAADAMFLHNMRLVHSVAQKYAGQGLEYDDLVQHAMRGLLRAVELFDPHAGCKFSTYATWWLRQSVTRALADEGRVIRIPVHMWETVRKVMRTRERMTREGKPPHVRELASECGLEVEKVVECLRLAPGVVSLDTPLGEDGFTLGDLVDAQSDTPEHIEVHGLFPEDLERLLGHLTAREEDVLRRRYSLAPYDCPSTLDEIGQDYGVTRERIRQIQTRAMDHLREKLASEGHDLDTAVPAKPLQRDGDHVLPSNQADPSVIAELELAVRPPGAEPFAQAACAG